MKFHTLCLSECNILEKIRTRLYRDKVQTNNIFEVEVMSQFSVRRDETFGTIYPLQFVNDITVEFCT